MEIGAKIKNARNNAGMTQEQAAEALGVSRQTVSNWENEKSYPDIISVVKMSDLYSVSLDHLLKEETPMEKNYMDYLEESTNVVKSKAKLSKLILILATLGIWIISLLVFWLLMDKPDAMGYSLIFIWILLPVTIFTVSLIIGKRDYFGKAKWLAVLIFGAAYTLAAYSTFSVANGLMTHTVIWPDFTKLPIGAAVSVAGLLIGIAADRFSRKKSDKNRT